MPKVVKAYYLSFIVYFLVWLQLPLFIRHKSMLESLLSATWMAVFMAVANKWLDSKFERSKTADTVQTQRKELDSAIKQNPSKMFVKAKGALGIQIGRLKRTDL